MVEIILVKIKSMDMAKKMEDFDFLSSFIEMSAKNDIRNQFTDHMKTF